MKTTYLKWLDAYYYLQGHYRESLYFTPYKFLIRKHIRKQIEDRLNTIKLTLCYTEGACVRCGCEVPALTMCDKTCHGNCYPKMKTKKEYKLNSYGK